VFVVKILVVGVGCKILKERGREARKSEARFLDCPPYKNDHQVVQLGPSATTSTSRVHHQDRAKH
jgi:hypothetical protein